MDCSPLDTTLFEVANPDVALLGASWFRDLWNQGEANFPILRNVRQELNWQDPGGREQQQYGYHFPQSPDLYVAFAPPTPEQQLPPHFVKFLVSFAFRVNIGKSSIP